jgi:peptide/nickel transport system substrate-binding protein
MRPFRLTLTLAAAIALVIAVAACGSSGSSSSATSGSSSGGSSSSSSSNSSGLSLSGLANTKPLPTQKMGGTLHMTSAEGWEHLDPGASYFQIDYLVVYATQTPLYMFTPSSPTRPVPGLADGMPQISSDGKTVTVHIKSGWKWSPPLNRDITSKDVAYAFQRDKKT